MLPETFPMLSQGISLLLVHSFSPHLGQLGSRPERARSGLDAGIDLTKELFIMVTYFTSSGYFAVVVNFGRSRVCRRDFLQRIKHLDCVTGPTVHTGTTPRANLALKAPMLVSQGISLLLVHRYPHSMPMM